MTVINFNILVYYYFKTKQTKQNRQQTLKIQTHPSLQDLIREDLCDEDDMSASQ